MWKQRDAVRHRETGAIGNVVTQIGRGVNPEAPLFVRWISGRESLTRAELVELVYRWEGPVSVW